MLYKILDNLDNLNQYNWVNSVYSFLVGVLNRGCKIVRKKSKFM